MIDENGKELYGKYDYHFWYQTYDGRWANKHGHLSVSAPELLDYGETPYSTSTSGWNLSSYIMDESGNYVLVSEIGNFYNSPMYFFIITTGE